MPNPEIRTLRISTSRSTRDLFLEVKEKMEKEYEGITDGQVLQMLLVFYETENERIDAKRKTK
jgi:hypothetical protein